MQKVLFLKKPIYLDYNATTPLDPEVIAAMRPFLEVDFGNPSSSHPYGARTKAAVEAARVQVAKLLGSNPEEIVFTSGGTESNNYAIKGAAFARRKRGNHVITSQVEHPAVTEVCAFLESQDFAVSYLPVDGFAAVDVGRLKSEIRSTTILISVMHANNEVGTVQPIDEMSRVAREHGILVHTDAAQSAGKIPTDVDSLGVDMLSIAGHKLYAPKGVGALYIRRGTRLEKLMHGAGHERGLRAGTENVLGIVGLGAACEIACRRLDGNVRHMQRMRDRLFEGLKASVPDLRLNGHPERRLPNTLSLSFRDVDATALLDSIHDKVAASAGAACHSGGVSASPRAEASPSERSEAGGVAMSHVLKAMKVPIEWARGTVRFSTGRMTTEAEIDAAVEIVADAVKSHRKELPSRGVGL